MTIRKKQKDGTYLIDTLIFNEIEIEKIEIEERITIEKIEIEKEE